MLSIREQGWISVYNQHQGQLSLPFLWGM